MREFPDVIMHSSRRVASSPDAERLARAVGCALARRQIARDCCFHRPRDRPRPAAVSPLRRHPRAESRRSTAADSSYRYGASSLHVTGLHRYIECY